MYMTEEEMPKAHEKVVGIWPNEDEPHFAFVDEAGNWISWNWGFEIPKAPERWMYASQNTKATLDKAYRQRNMVFIMLGVYAAAADGMVFWGIDENEDWDREWRTVLYVDLRDGQICFHIEPDLREHVERIFPEQPEWHEWDGEWWDTHEKRLERIFKRL